MSVRFDEPLLTAAQERSLARAIEGGVAAQAVLDGVAGFSCAAGSDELRQVARLGKQARDRLVRANLRLVHQVAHREATRCGLSRDELFQEGVVGLLEAVRRWDYRRELRFTTYAIVWIRNLVHGAAATRLGEVNLAPRTAVTLYQVRGVVREIEARGERASAAAVGRELGMGERAAAGWIGYTAPVSMGDALMSLPFAAPEPEEQAGDVAAGLLRQLPVLQQRLLRLRFGLDGEALTQQQVAERWGWPISRVRRLEAAALAELRELAPACLEAA